MISSKLQESSTKNVNNQTKLFWIRLEFSIICGTIAPRLAEDILAQLQADDSLSSPMKHLLQVLVVFIQAGARHQYADRSCISASPGSDMG